MSKRGAVQSCRGGSGTSNITANRAVTLREPGQRVGMVETAIQSPGVPMLCGMTEADQDDTRTRYRWGACTITQAASHGSEHRRQRARDERSLPRSSRSVSAGAHAGIAHPVPTDTRCGAAASITSHPWRRAGPRGDVSTDAPSHLLNGSRRTGPQLAPPPPTAAAVSAPELRAGESQFPTSLRRVQWSREAPGRSTLCRTSVTSFSS